MSVSTTHRDATAENTAIRPFQIEVPQDRADVDGDAT